MKKLILASVLGLILVLITAPAVLAGPPSPPDYGKYNPIDLPYQPPEEWGVEKVKPPFSAPGGSVRIITDPLTGVLPEDGDGWVTFWCQSKIGFQYNIGATGLDPLSKYSVKAFGIQAHVVPPPAGADPLDPSTWPPGYIYVPPPEDFWIQIDAYIELDLGTLRTDANGLGGVKGVKKLTSGYLYDVAVVVFDSNGVPVLEPGLNSPPMPPIPDTNGFLVY